MARATYRLKALTVASIKTTGMYADGRGLYLKVSKSGTKSWVFIFQWMGKRKEMGLGSVASIGLADARKQANKARQLVANWINPIQHREEQRSAQTDD